MDEKKVREDAQLILEHGAHVWTDLILKNLVPSDVDQTVFPPDVPFKYVGTSAFHCAAMLVYAKKIQAEVTHGE